MWKVIVFCIIMDLTVIQCRRNYEGYMVFNIIPRKKLELEKLSEMKDVPGYSFWKEPSVVNKEVDLMVAPTKLQKFNEMLQVNGIQINAIGNVQQLISETEMNYPTDELFTDIPFDFNRYHNLDTIYNNLDSLAKHFPNNVEIIVAGKTYEEREIKGIKIFYEHDKPGIFIEGGIHGREWISPATVMYIVYQLLTDNDTDVRNLVESHNWYIFPVFNPDGYEYTHTTDRLWKKTLAPYNASCVGVDLNRNFNFLQETTYERSQPCSDNYPGPRSLSEIEARSLTSYITSIADRFYAYISFHGYSKNLLFLYNANDVANFNDLDAIALKAATALGLKYRTEYHIRNITNIALNPGSTVHYIKNYLNKPIVCNFNLDERHIYRFLSPYRNIIPTGYETMKVLIAMFKEAKARGYPKDIKN